VTSLGGGVPDPLNQRETADFVREHLGWMLRLARCYVVDNALAEDAVQAAFAKIFERIEQFKGKSTINSWMRTIVINECLMLLRKRPAPDREIDIDPLMPEFDQFNCRIEPSWNRVPTAEQFMIASETQSIIMDAINQLPDKYRVVLLLRDVEEKSTAEVAEILNQSQSNIKTRLHRARAALKTLLEPHMRKGDLPL